MSASKAGPVAVGETRPLTNGEADAVGCPRSWRVANVDGQLVLLQRERRVWQPVQLGEAQAARVREKLDGYWNPPPVVVVDTGTLTRILKAVRAVLNLDLPRDIRAELVWVKRRIGGE